MIDCGLVRLRAINKQSSLESLRTVHVSRASADQRAGHAGRVRPGKVYRLYTGMQIFLMDLRFDITLYIFNRPRCRERVQRVFGSNSARDAEMRPLAIDPPAKSARCREYPHIPLSFSIQYKHFS